VVWKEYLVTVIFSVPVEVNAVVFVRGFAFNNGLSLRQQSVVPLVDEVYYSIACGEPCRSSITGVDGVADKYFHKYEVRVSDT
jgi:hypothetical protein